MAETPNNLYPHFAVENNKKPNKFYAFPFIGFIFKIAIALPVIIEIVFLGVVALYALFINWFVILFTGKYWDPAYKLFLGLLRLNTKVKLFAYGITDKYPGFRLNTNNLFTFDLAKPEKPNRWLAIPIIGIFVRFILLIPYIIFAQVMGKGSQVAILISWFAVLFKNKFPESLYEFERDTLRVSAASTAYMVGLSDKYPSFMISMEHQTEKILLIIAGALMSFSSSWPMDGSGRSNYRGEYAPKPFYREDSYQKDFQPDYSPQTYPQNNTY